jgi:hypothetical protein
VPTARSSLVPSGQRAAMVFFAKSPSITAASPETEIVRRYTGSR